MEPTPVKKPPSLVHIPRHNLGWVLVFDLDNTIVGEYYNLRKYPARKLPLNPFAVNILRYAIQEKEEISAIILLTNNNDTDFISHIDALLKEELGLENKEVFDMIMDSNHPMRELIHGGPMHGTHKKSFKDVFHCLKLLNKSTEDLLNRCIFIDDQIYHQLAIELIAAGKQNQFLHIHPPYRTPEPFLIHHAPSTSSNTFVRIRRAYPQGPFTVKPNPPLLDSSPQK